MSALARRSTFFAYLEIALAQASRAFVQLRARSRWPAPCDVSLHARTKRRHVASAGVARGSERKEHHMATRNIQQKVVSDVQLRDGLSKGKKRTDKIVIEGKEEAVGSIMTMLDTRIANTRAVEDARAAFHDAVAAQRAYDAQTAPIIDGVRAQLAIQLGPSERASYGVRPRKKAGRRSFDEHVAAVQKLRATRKSHHEEGSPPDVATAPSPPATTNGASANGAVMNGSSMNGLAKT
jgi:hypothetical protein